MGRDMATMDEQIMAEAAQQREHEARIEKIKAQKK